MIRIKRRRCMDIKDLKSLIKMVTDTDITEFKLETAGEKVCIRRGKAPEIVSYAIPQPVAVPQVAMEVPAKVISAPSVTPASDTSQSITSPIVGTMYRSPSPDAPPYVEIGQIVEKGQVLCIVEAMKLMNEIEAEYRCRITKICKENAQPVEYGEPLFLVEPL
jgi:acetyl-CoA carboxylase biotin carboxyl carrier protein